MDLFRSPAFIDALIETINTYQVEHLMSNRELSIAAGLSPSMISKIKNKQTYAKTSTLRKLKVIGVQIPSIKSSQSSL